MSCAAGTDAMDSEDFPNETDNRIDNLDEPVIAMAIANAIAAAVFSITAVALTVTVLVCVACLFNYVVKLHTAVDALTVVFIAVKKLGVKFAELFVTPEKINSAKFVQKNINNPQRLRKIAFLLFFIPGTPKDLFTYLFALTPMKYPEFIVISLIARLPSVVSSTIGGNLIANGKYVAAIVLFAATGVLSICGWLCYDRYST